MKTGADHIAEQLYSFGVRVAFVFTGGAISAVIDSVSKIGIKIIPYDHELDASYAAEGYVRATSKPAVVLVTSGPGVTNAITGIAGSWFDSIPVLFITGQVKSFEKTNFELNLQNGFQETDVIKSTSHLSKFSKSVEHCTQIIPALKDAFKFMLTGRPGPAVLDITMDAQSMIMDDFNIDKSNFKFNDILSKGSLAVNNSSFKFGYQELLKNIISSKKPVILIGGGLQWLQNDLFTKVSKKLEVKVISTYAGINAINHDNFFYEGMIGPFGHIKANKTLIEASDLFILGARVPQRALPLLSKKNMKKLISIRKYVLTVDPKEFINHKFGFFEKIYYGLAYDFLKFVDKKINKKAVKAKKGNNKSSVLPKNMFLSIPSKSDYSLNEKNSYSVNHLIDSLNNNLPKNSNIFVDVGQNAVALALGLKRVNGERLFSSWANSPMGYSLPASLGAALDYRNRKSICIIGDGGLRTAFSSLPNLKLMKGKVKIILWDNQGYRTIVDHIEKMLSGRRQAVTEKSGIPNISLEKVLLSCDLELLHSKNNLNDDMKLFFNNSNIDVLVVPIDHSIRMIPNKVL